MPPTSVRPQLAPRPRSTARRVARVTALAAAGVFAVGLALGLSGCAAPARPSAAGVAATTDHASPLSADSNSSFFADSTTPANPATPTPTSPTPTTPWDGQYVVTLHTKWFGPVHARMDMQPTATSTSAGFKANTPPDVAWSLLGGVEGAVGPILMPFIFPRGMIFTWEGDLARLAADGTPIPGEGSIGPGTLERLRIKTRIATPGAPAELIFKEDRVMGTLTVQPLRDARPRVTDFPLLAQQIKQTMPAALYDAALARDPKLQTFFEDLASGSARARDDLEFMFAGAAAARKNIEFQMPLIFPERQTHAWFETLTVAALADNAYKVGPDNELEGVAVVRFDAFLDVRQVDEAMALALRSYAKPRPDSAGVGGVILDLRTSTGVDLAAFRAAQWLITDPIDAGAYVGPAPREAGTPLPRIDLRTPSDYDLLAQTLETVGGADITIWPVDQTPFSGPTFTDPVVVVTSDRTSSTSEALVAVLKRAGRVRVVGQPTAGRPLLSREVALGQGWILRVAGYDLLAPLGADPGLKDNRGVKGASPMRAQPEGQPNGQPNGQARCWQRSVAPHIKSSGDGVDEARREMRKLIKDRIKDRG